MKVAPPYSAGARLRAIALPQLIALKLYAGGDPSRQDILALLAANPDANVDEIRDVCNAYRLPVRGLF